MKQIINRLFFTTLAAVTLLATGCSKEPQTEGDTDGTYLSLSIDGVKAVNSAKSTRATAVNEGVITDVWVLQFKMKPMRKDGTLVAKSYIATVVDPAKILFRFAKGDNMAVYLVANSGDNALFRNTAIGTTLASVEEQSISATTTAGNNFPTETSANLPMVGRSDTHTFPISNNLYTTVPVVLTRVVSKIALTIKNPLATGYPQLAVASVQLKNAPKAYRAHATEAVYGFDGSYDGKLSPAALAANFGDYTAVAGNITAAGTTSTYYLAPNLRGVSTNTDDRLKSDLTAPAGQGNFCTYVEIVGTAKSSATAPAVDVRYRLYLGANNTNNFNLEANVAYKVDVELTGINGNDARMTITTDRFDLIEGDTDGDYSEDIGGFAPPPPVVGDYYYSDGSYSTDLDASKTATGLIYWIDPADIQIYKVMSLEESEDTLQWAEYNNCIVSGAQSDTNGKANSAAIKAYFEANTATVGSDFAVAFAAASYCYNYTGKAGSDAVGSWHLPAKHELQYLWCAYNGAAPVIWNDYPAPAPPLVSVEQEKWDKLIEAGGVSFGITKGLHRSSTESSTSTSEASLFDFRDGSTYNDGKEYGYAVRCVRDILPPPPVVGDYYYSDGSYSTALEEGKIATGLVYYLDPADPQKYKVMSLEESGKLKWAASISYAVSGAQSDTDGKSNSAAIKKAFDDKLAGIAITETDFAVAFPAAAYCYNYTGKAGTDAKGSWHLPAKSELQYLWCSYNGVVPRSWENGINTAAPTADAAQTLWNDRIKTGGVTAGIIASNFWSSTETSGYTSNAWYVYFSYGSTNFYYKTYGYYVRCVRDL